VRKVIDMVEDTFTRGPDAVPVFRTYCPSCRSKNTAVSYRNSDGQRYCRCLACACRFWGD
jgi:hypothetical protein